MKKILALLVVVSAPGLAHAAAFQNGSFEAGSLGNIASFDMLGTGSTAITGWTVTGGNIDYIGGLWAAADGARSLDMVGNSLGTIAQTFDTTSGAKYKVGFSMSVNPANPNYSLTRQMRVTAGDEFADYAYTATNNNYPTPMNWDVRTFEFTADAATTTLSFTARNGECCYGPALDNVSVTQLAAPVPEPETYAMMLAGLGMLGFVARRRKQKAVA